MSASDHIAEANLLCGDVQSMERVRLPKLPFGKKKKKKGSRKTRPLKAVQGLKAWAKAQSVMLYGVEHDEIWVHEGFNEVTQRFAHSREL